MSEVFSVHARFTLTAAACALLGACDAEIRDRAARDTSLADTTVTAGEVAGAIGPTPTTGTAVLAILDAVNSGAIETGRLAQRKATSTAVRAFARRMVDEHIALRRQGSELAQRLNTPATLPDDDEFVKDYRDEQQELQDKTGDDLNREYIDHELKSHEALIEEIDDALEATQTKELKQFLQQAKLTLEAHREAAEEVKEGLDG